MSDLPVRPDPIASDADLERALIDLGRRLEYPATPDLAGTVRARITVQPAARAGWRVQWPSRRAFAIAALALVFLAAGLLFLSPNMRRAVAERLGLPGVTITRIEAIYPGYETPVPSADPAGRGLGLGTQVGSLAEAASAVSFPVLQPTLPELGAPDAVYIAPNPPGGHVALVYWPRADLPATTETGVALLFTEFRGTLDPAFIRKGLPPGTRLEQLTLSGKPAYWIEGRPHFFFFRDQSGRPMDERFRLASNVLLWEQGGLTLRMEAAFSKDQALRIAASVR